MPTTTAAYLIHEARSHLRYVTLEDIETSTQAATVSQAFSQLAIAEALRTIAENTPPEPRVTQQALAAALCEVYEHDDHPAGCNFMMGRAARLLEILDEGGAR